MRRCSWYTHPFTLPKEIFSWLTNPSVPFLVAQTMTKKAALAA